TGPPCCVVESSAQSEPSAAEPEASALEREADRYAAAGRRGLAAPLSARAIELRADSDAPASEAQSLAQLAVIAHDRGHLDEAEHFYRRALAEDASDGRGDS